MRNIKGKAIKSFLLLCILSGFAILLMLWPGEKEKGKSDRGKMLEEIGLLKPAFAQEVPEAFPADEAGISAYVNAGQNIDLEKAKKAFVGIRAEGDDYVIGIMGLEGLPEDEFPHMYLSQSGWILAYYSKIAPASRIMQWHGYTGGPITTTTLQDAIAKICPEIRVDFSKVKDNIAYYHFQYPEATKMVMSVDMVTEGKEDAFNFLIPFNVTLFEGSWSLRGCESYGTWYRSSLYLDGGKISDSKGIENDKFQAPHLTLGKVHNVKIESFTEDCVNSGVATIFIYQ